TAGSTAASWRWTRRTASRSPRRAVWLVNPAMSVKRSVMRPPGPGRTGKSPATQSMSMPGARIPVQRRVGECVKFHAPASSGVGEDASMSPFPASSTELAERHRREVLRYLLRLLGDAEEAQDACQQTFLHAHRAFGRLRPDSNVRAWLFRIATNTARSVARSRARRAGRMVQVELDGLPGGSAASLEHRAQLRAVARGGPGVPPGQRPAPLLAPV